jgi:hypothetical protein
MAEWAGDGVRLWPVEVAFGITTVAVSSTSHRKLLEQVCQQREGPFFARQNIGVQTTCGWNASTDHGTEA